jgi:uncharacterized protein YcgI (DUF1989 family)
MVLKRGVLLKLIDLEGGANVGMMFYNPANTLERYRHRYAEVPAAQAAPRQLPLFRHGADLLLHRQGQHRWHDTVCGNTTKAIVARRWGARDSRTIATTGR